MTCTVHTLPLKRKKSSEKVLVISEIGLDFMNGSPDRAIQYQAFRQQIKLALNLNIPIVFHSRDAHLETLRILREESAYKVGGIMHYFQASLDIAYQAIGEHPKALLETWGIIWQTDLPRRIFCRAGGLQVGVRPLGSGIL